MPFRDLIHLIPGNGEDAEVTSESETADEPCGRSQWQYHTPWRLQRTS